MHCQRASKQTPSKSKYKNWALTTGLLMMSFAGAVQAADFFPLAPGNNWTYQDAKTGATLKVEVALTQVMAGDHVYHVLKGYTPAPKWIRVNEYGNLVYFDSDLEQEFMLTSFEVVPGGWFEAHGRQCPEQGQAQDKRAIHDGPAGSWNALEIQYRPYACADAGDVSEQYAENIGMVRRVANTIAGPRTYDLVSAKIGHQYITAGTHGSFSVISPGDPKDGVWNVKLRVEQEASPGVKVVFPSSQEYDLRLRDDDGNILWSWSANKLFLQTLHERNFGTWEQSVEVPVPPGAPEFYRTYVLEAWLTTAPDGPLFAAATRVTVPGISPATTVAIESRRVRVR